MAEKQPRDRYDVVIIRGGPAGMAAAIYTVRQGLSTAIIARELGGQAQWVRSWFELRRQRRPVAYISARCGRLRGLR